MKLKITVGSVSVTGEMIPDGRAGRYKTFVPGPISIEVNVVAHVMAAPAPGELEALVGKSVIVDL